MKYDHETMPYMSAMRPVGRDRNKTSGKTSHCHSKDTKDRRVK